MISKIEGEVAELGENYVVLKVHGISYEIQVIQSVVERLKNQPNGEKVDLIIFHYVPNLHDW